MELSLTQDFNSVFRTEAWVQAWIDTWGKDSRIKLIDLGGRGRPLETVYTTKYYLKQIIPVKTLCLAGTGYASISTPRSEYNDINQLVAIAGSTDEFYRLIRKLDWQQFFISDVLDQSVTSRCIDQISHHKNLLLHEQKNERVYAVEVQPFEHYLQRLGANTRLSFFNRRKNLARQGELTFSTYSLNDIGEALALLNLFHIARWGRPCYSADSQKFISNFCERLVEAGGDFILQSMQVDGEAISIIFDVVWAGTRYNLQSGYLENKYPKIALGALHLGYSIESALEKKQVYDFMAGVGKNSDYKNRIATRVQIIKTVSLNRSYLKVLRSAQNYFK